MKQVAWWLTLACVALTVTAGCGPRSTADPERDANGKVEAARRLAAALASDPNGIEARGALEEFRAYSIDVQKNRKQAEEIVQIYRERIQGKYRGEVAQEVQGEMRGVESALNANK